MKTPGTLLLTCVVLWPLTGCAQEKRPNSLPATPAVERPTSMWLTAYYGTYSDGGANAMPPHEVTWEGITHVIHFGMNATTTPPYFTPLTTPDDSIALFWGMKGVWNKEYAYSVLDTLKKYARGSKLLLASGGAYGEGANALSWILADPGRAETYASTVCSFARRHGYDGLELDWEPVFSSEPESRIQAKMSLLIRLMRKGLDTWKPRGILSIATTTGVEKRYDPEIQDMVDQYNIMCYDLHQSPGWHGRDVTGFNAPLRPPDRNTYPILSRFNYNLEGIVDGDERVSGPRAMMANGIRPWKIGVGLPFFGYVYSGNDAPGQRRIGTAQFVSYEQVIRSLGAGGQWHWDETTKSPWVGGTIEGTFEPPFPTAGERFFVTYDDSASIAEKIAWTKSLGLGGVMVFDLWRGWDAKAQPSRREPLLRSAVRALNAR